MTRRVVDIHGISFAVESEVPSWPEFWNVAGNGHWEPDMFDFMDRFLQPGWRWIDIGAWIGPTALYAAAKGAEVDAYECDPVALARLRHNIHLNGHLKIKVFGYALADFDGSMTMWTREPGNSELTAIHAPDLYEPIPVLARDALKELPSHLDDRTIVKMDIEGSEFALLPRLTRLIAESRCLWHVSFHPQLVPRWPAFDENALRIAEMIRSLAVFAGHNWYNTQMRLLSKSEVIHRIQDGGSGLGTTMIFSR